MNYWTRIASIFLFSILTASAETPNIILVYADDVGYGDLGCYGATAVQTPSLDALAENGRRFMSAYATASTCTPSRYSLLTGEYAFRNKDAVILPGNAPLIIDPAKPTLASVLGEAGYGTGLVGKWHLGLGSPATPLDWNGEIAPGPRELGFSYSFHMAATGDRVPTVFIENGRIVDLNPDNPITVSYQNPLPSEPTGISHPEMLTVQADRQHSGTVVNGVSRIGWMKGGEEARWKDEDFSDICLGKAIKFISDNRDQPFFLYFATHENHVPRVPHPRFKGSSSLGPRGDAIVQLDWSVGRIVQALQQYGIYENTLILFSSDNGPVLFDGYYDGAWERNGNHRPAGPWKGGKYSAWEGGTRMPLIVSWPGRIEPGRSDALISQVDFLATFASLTGVEIPEGAAGDSQDLKGLLLGDDESGRDHLLQQGVTMIALRQGEWKYLPEGKVRTRNGIGRFTWDTIPSGGGLYYLPEDPLEQVNVAEAYPHIARDMAALLKEQVGRSASPSSGADSMGGAD